MFLQGEELAGAPLMCQAAGEWHLVGVSAWRKGCAGASLRPRLYDKVAPSSTWAKTTMEQMDKANKKRIPKKSAGDSNG